jgi:HAD superfamily hydrolase (TIGR01549 family)
MAKLFAFDFHGVLEKNNEYAVQELMKMTLRHFGFETHVSIEKVQAIYGKPWFDYMKHFAPVSDSTAQAMVDKVLEIQAENGVVQRFIKPQDHAREVLGKIQEGGHRSIVVSNTYPEHISMFLNALQLGKLVHKNYGVDSKQGVISKEDILKRAAQEYDADSIVMIGDTEEDIQAGKAAGATTYLFINRANVNRKFTTEPDYIIHDLRDVLVEL